MSMLGTALPTGLVCLAFTALPLAGQIAPTLPSDTLGGRKLAPEANVPSGIVAPTLPSDTLMAGACLRSDTITARIVQSTPRRRDPADTTNATALAAADSTARCADGTYPKQPRQRSN